MAYFKAKKMKINGRYYPVAVLTDRPMEIDEVAEQIAEASTVSKADVLAVLTSLPPVMARGMNAGRSVHLDGVGRFRYTIAAKKGGKATPEEVTANDVERTRIHFTPEGTRVQGVVTRALTNRAHWTLWTGSTVPEGGEETPGTSEDDGNDDGEL